MAVWHATLEERAGLLFNFSDAIVVVERKFPETLVPVSDGRMFIASDYSGQHKEAVHESHSFLISTNPAMERWLPLLEQFREKWLPDGRRISYKKLKEPTRWRALPAFLETIGQLEGNLITVMIDRRMGSFMSGGPAKAMEVFPDCFPPEASHGTVEKMLRLASFVALIVCGLRGESQPATWLSDHDETLDGHEKREQFARLASYLTFKLTGWRQPADMLFTTTEALDIPSWSEDVAAIPDLAAGAYCQLVTCLPAFFGEEPCEVAVQTDTKDQRASAIVNWLASERKILKHLLLRAELDSAGQVQVSAQAFRTP